MKIAILQCDSVLDKFRAQFDDYPVMMEHMFQGLGEFKFTTFNVQLGHYPDRLDEWDLFLISGSKASAYDQEPWILQLIGFVRELNTHHKKTFGICFGHQIMAEALGCKVQKSEKGWGVGIATNQMVHQPSWMKGTPSISDLHILVSHQDQVTAIPQSAAILAASDFCPYFFVQWSSYFLSIQGHPEWSREYAKTLLLDRLDRIPKDAVDTALLSYDLNLDSCYIVRLILQFARESISKEL